MEEINTIYVEMPTTIRSYVVCNKDSTYTIVINSRLSHEQNSISYDHELSHICNGDYEKRTDINLIEIMAHSAIL